MPAVRAFPAAALTFPASPVVLVPKGSHLMRFSGVQRGDVAPVGRWAGASGLGEVRSLRWGPKGNGFGKALSMKGSW